jgi:hypothetical protein
MYNVNYKVTSYNPATMHMTVATFQYEEDARFYANGILRMGRCEVKVYAL